MSRVRVELLGGFKLVADEREWTRLRTRKAMLLLAALALARGEHLTRERLCERLWPEADPEAARHSLRQALATLRQALGATLRTDGHDRVWLSPEALACDVRELEAQVRVALAPAASPVTRQRARAIAARLVKGELLPGFYEDWVLAERERLEAVQARLEALSPPEPASPLIRLPLRLSRFLGRERERARLLTWLESGERLVVVTGSGGMGKTRLAVEAAEAAESFDLVLFVPLDATTDGRELASRVLESLGESGEASIEPLQQVAERLGRFASALLLLDNLEQVAGAAEAVRKLLEVAPDVRCLATSRSPLGIVGERELPLGPLPETESRALLRDRIAAVRPELEPDDATLDALGERLGGLPLALELAAARVRTFSLSALLAALDGSGLPVLAAPRSDLPERHRTLEATLAWSYALLSEAGQRELRRLSVFRGGPREAADGAALDELVWHALATIDESGRFRIPELTRRFVEARLSENPDERARAEAEHRGWLIALLEGDPHPREADNLRAALERLLASDLGAFVQLHDLGARLFLPSGLWREWGRWARRGLERELLLPGRIALHLAALRALDRQERVEEAIGHGEEAVRLARSSNLPLREAEAERFLGQVFYREPERARERFERSRQLLERHSPDPFLAPLLGDLALTASLSGRFDEAERHARAGLAELEQPRPNLTERDVREQRSLLWATLGKTLAAQGKLAEARLCRDERRKTGIPDPHGDLALTLAIGERAELRTLLAERRMLPGGESLWHYFSEQARLAQDVLENPALAALLHGAHERQLRDLHEPLAPPEAAQRTLRFPQLRAILGESAFDARFAEGLALSWDEALLRLEDAC